MIGLELLKAYKRGAFPKILVSPPSLVARVKARLHKHESASLGFIPTNRREIKQACQQCGKIFRANEGQKLSAHKLNLIKHSHANKPE